MDTTQLVTRCQAGDSLAIEDLVRTYQPVIFRLAVSILGDPAEADEAIQDALVAALGNLGSFRGEAGFTTWLYTITLNVCRGRLRKRRTQARLLGLLQAWFWLKRPVEAQPEEMASRNETDTRLWQAVAALDDRRREAVILCYYHDLTLAEIGQFGRIAGSVAATAALVLLVAALSWLVWTEKWSRLAPIG